jgi:L-fucose mutarotase/ribose pyranase (RbsD/FucU family)
MLKVAPLLRRSAARTGIDGHGDELVVADANFSRQHRRG